MYGFCNRDWYPSWIKNTKKFNVYRIKKRTAVTFISFPLECSDRTHDQSLSWSINYRISTEDAALLAAVRKRSKVWSRTGWVLWVCALFLKGFFSFWKGLKSNSWICCCNVVQKLVRVLADERFFVVASCWRFNIEDFHSITRKSSLENSPTSCHAMPSL